MKRILIAAVALAAIAGSVHAGGKTDAPAAGSAAAPEKLMVYTSLKEVLIGELKDAYSYNFV